MGGRGAAASGIVRSHTLTHYVNVLHVFLQVRVAHEEQCKVRVYPMRKTVVGPGGYGVNHHLLSCRLSQRGVSSVALIQERKKVEKCTAFQFALPELFYNHINDQGTNDESFSGFCT